MSVDVNVNDKSILSQMLIRQSNTK